MELTIITYDSGSAQINRLAPSAIGELERYKNESKITWINVGGLEEPDAIKRIGELFDLHPLTIEDILHLDQQPKVEVFENYRFLSIKTIKRDKYFSHEQDNELDEFLIDQISLILMDNVLITFQEIANNSFDGIRRKILEGAGGIRSMGIGYLVYSIIDSVVDEYFLTLNHLEEDIEDFEERATRTSDYKFIEEIQDTKKYLLRIKRAIMPLQDNILAITHHGILLQTDELKPFIQDLHEHINHAITLVENHREWLSNIMDVNLSVLSHQTNKVMKVLAIISTIFIPLTFLAGIYGMNFDFMPELRYEFGYPIVLGGMGLVALTMVAIFKIHRWF
jgi:magnesium transporter